MLEVGAGDGRLSHYLRRYLPAGVALVATDAQPRRATRCAIEALDVEAALRTHAPALVLACWMPAGRDWTAALRACASCREYVLVGPADSAISGHEWLTWGRGGQRGEVAPHAAAGWTRHDVAEVARWQLCRIDLLDFALGRLGEATAAPAPDACAHEERAEPGVGEEEEEAAAADDAFASASSTTAFRRAAPQPQPGGPNAALGCAEPGPVALT